MILYQLLRPLGYLRIDQSDKRIADWYIPLLVAVAATSGQALLYGSINIYGADGVIDKSLSFVQNLPGFYIAALAAIATFGRQDIDEVMPGNPPPSIETRTVIGKRNRIPLTRRRFLCLLFAFLTVECILLTMASIIGLSVAPALVSRLPGYAVITLHFVGFFLFSFLLAQLVVATFWGLYYLGDRIHQPDT
ncbi:hypothetical protein M6D76_08685 [Alcaligenes faecalis]|uniref:hypothetical protein n=1 Tax=Alcaligenes faecalis TaxID=511 RepID=UPI00211C81E2|nr:hypothetical protein [Alcaligenes faecalis]UUO12737.1 hypothetical protein M6D76_08685 [Alcaligenes faecalis]